jgi:thiamine pyrophosphate-dependent acetolactate synthase large subunit-like protein
MNDSRIAPVFQILAEDIHALGVRTVFGLMSDDTAVFAVTLDGLGVKFVGARHENNAIAMAEGYAYATGELGVAVIGRGPATANGLHAAVAASRMGSRVLVIYGDAAVGGGAVNGIGPDYKGFNAQAVLGAAGLTCFTAASAATARQTLADAVAAASPGALAALLLPTDRCWASRTAPSFWTARSTRTSPRPSWASSPNSKRDSTADQEGRAGDSVIVAAAIS